MPFKVCPVCKTPIRSSEFARHKKAHDNQGKKKHWVGSAPTRTKALKRDNHRCTRCHRSKDNLNVEGKPLQLHVHHKDENSSNDRLENLITLCEECHPRGGNQRWSGM